MQNEDKKMIAQFSEIGLSDLSLVGGKNASLGEMVRDMKAQGIRVPNGFAMTVHAYHRHLDANNLQDRIDSTLENVDPKNVADLAERARKVRDLIISAPLPEDISLPMLKAYDNLGLGSLTSVAVRSSATAEDLPEASFAGQQDTYLNVQGHLQLVDAYKRCVASLFTDRAIAYRHNLKISHRGVALSVGIQQMVRSDLASSGVMFSIDTETGFRDVVLINSSYGLGETIVQGAVNPDEFMVFKPTLRQGFRPIIEKRLGSKEIKMIYDLGGGKMTKTLPTSNEERKNFSLTDEEILQLSKWALAIETHYSRKYARDVPMDMEWAKDGATGELFIVQARPETVESNKSHTEFESYHFQPSTDQTTIKIRRKLGTGRSVGGKIGKGKVRVIRDIRDLDTLQMGEVLVTEKTNPDWEPVLRRASAIITDQGGRTCHAAIVSRELGIPAVVGTSNATQTLKTGQEVTVSCAEGETGNIYEGLLDFTIERIDLSKLRRPKTKVMMNVANPEEALQLSFIPNDGVGLAREEFIVTNYVKIHPMALVEFEKVQSTDDRKKILDLTTGYAKKEDYFVDKLAQGVALLAAAFYPKDVILRFSDFKTNEYAHLIGGQGFEPHEENPMRRGTFSTCMLPKGNAVLRAVAKKIAIRRRQRATGSGTA